VQFGIDLADLKGVWSLFEICIHDRMNRPGRPVRQDDDFLPGMDPMEHTWFLLSQSGCKGQVLRDLEDFLRPLLFQEIDNPIAIGERVILPQFWIEEV